MHEDELLLQVTDGVAVVTLNRPQARNALSMSLLAALRHTMVHLDADDSVAVVVLTGADPAFCAGIDLKELGSGRKNLAEQTAQAPVAIQNPFEPLAKPVVAAVNGPAVTGGLELALTCSFIVASERAAFADTHARVGLQPSWGMTVGLAEAVGVRRAREMSASGAFVDAATALAWGLVNHVAPHEQLLDVATRLALDIAGGDQRAVGRLLQTYAEQRALSTDPARLIETTAQRLWFEGGAGLFDDIERRRELVRARGHEAVQQQ